MEQDTTVEKVGIQEVAAWLVIVVLVTLIVKTLSFLFIPLSVSLLIFFALGMPLEFLRRFGVPGWLRIFLVVSIVLGSMYLIGWLVQANVLECVAQMPVIEEQLSKNQYKIGMVFEKLRIRKVTAEEILQIVPDLTTFQNINHQHDLARLAAMGV